MVYKWYILPIGGLYITYHLLREPGNSHWTSLHFGYQVGIFITPPKFNAWNLKENDGETKFGVSKLPGVFKLPAVKKTSGVVSSSWFTKHFLYKDVVHHPTETSIYKWLALGFQALILHDFCENLRRQLLQIPKCRSKMSSPVDWRHQVKPRSASCLVVVLTPNGSLWNIWIRQIGWKSSPSFRGEHKTYERNHHRVCIV